MIRLDTLTLSRESIQWQTVKFRDELSAWFGKARQKGPSLPKDPVKFYQDDIFEELKDLVQEHLGLKILLAEGDFMVRPAIIKNGDVVLFDKKLGPVANFILSWFPEVDEVVTPKHLVQLNKNVLETCVDLKNSKITGDLAKIPSAMYMPMQVIQGVAGRSITDRELAAIYIHEFGHIFTYFEHLECNLTANQILCDLIKVQNNVTDDHQRRFMIGKIADAAEMSSLRKQKLEEAKGVMQIAVIVFDQAQENIKSSLNRGKYESITSETLADQFSARHGCSLDLATGLDKLMSDNEAQYQILADPVEGYWALSAMQSALNIVLVTVYFTLAISVIGIPIIWAISVATNTREKDFDILPVRLRKLVHENTNRLKDRSISSVERDQLVQDNIRIEELVAKYSEIEKIDIQGENIVERISRVVKSKYADDKDFEYLQIGLHDLANNRLFDQAAKLKSIAG